MNRKRLFAADIQTWLEYLQTNSIFIWFGNYVLIRLKMRRAVASSLPGIRIVIIMVFPFSTNSLVSSISYEKSNFITGI
jgi:hypothetical protein